MNYAISNYCKYKLTASSCHQVWDSNLHVHMAFINAAGFHGSFLFIETSFNSLIKFGTIALWYIIICKLHIIILYFLINFQLIEFTIRLFNFALKCSINVFNLFWLIIFLIIWMWTIHFGLLTRGFWYTLSIHIFIINSGYNCKFVSPRFNFGKVFFVNTSDD